MINLKDGELADVSPFKGDPRNDAFSYAVKKMMQFILEKADGTRTYSIIQNLPDDILDMLAVELRTMYYEETMDISVKRNIIQNTLSWYAKAGTPAAVEELISVVFGSGKIVEWFDFTEPPYTPGTFDIVTNAPMERGIIDTLSAIIDRVKNARSQIRRVVINRDLHQGASIAMRSVAVTETVVLNYEHYANEAALNNYYAASQNATTETFVINSDDQNSDARSGNYASQIAISHGGATTVLNNNETQDTIARQEIVDVQQAAILSNMTTVLNDNKMQDTTGRQEMINAQQAAILSETTHVL